ncbi:MAG: hypothetical protein CL674_07030 [Bdellovibrionaceae bacterium]|nr:hypothetical protein [Pseudobdellovibrionaceae bacterium]|tara:strand:- start:7814 stop:9430 length:1617 start_codon:yes stop_codon:yes gene_type:complete
MDEVNLETIVQKLMQDKRREWIAFIFMQCLLIGFCIQTYDFMYENEQKSFQKEIYEIGILEKNNFERDLRHRLLAFDRLAFRIKDTSEDTKSKWYAEVKNYHRDFHGTLAIEFVNQDSMIEWIYPIQGNEKVIGKVLNQSGSRKESLKKSMASRRGTYTEPLDLIQGGRGFLSFHPVFDESNRYLGYIVGVFHGEKYFADLESFDFYLQVSIDGKQVFSNFNEIKNASLSKFSQSIPMDLSGTKGMLQIIPNEKHFKSLSERSKALEFILAAYAVGFLFSLVIFSYVHFLVKREESRINEVEVSRLTYAGKLSAGLAHEINNPLAILKASTNRLSRYHDFSDSKSQKILGDIYKAVSRIQQLTQKLVFFVEKPVANQIPVSLKQLSTESIELNLKDFEGIQVKLENLLKQDYYIKYPVRFKLCLNQLFNNSIEALKGRLDAKITLRLSETSEYVIIVLEDNGVGIAKHDLEEVFSPFFSTKSLKSGSGLGLSFAEKIVKDLNGQIKIRSQEWKGTKVTIKIPISELATQTNSKNKLVA